MVITDFIHMPLNDNIFCVHCQGTVEVVLLYCDRSCVLENIEKG